MNNVIDKVIRGGAAGIAGRENLRETVLRVLGEVAPEADTAALAPDVSFHEQIELDSIDFLRLMMGLEKALGITIFDFDYPRLSTLNGCERYLGERLRTYPKNCCRHQ